MAESIIGLMIFSMIIGLTVSLGVGIKNQHLDSKTFFEEYNRCFKSAQNRSLLNHKKIKIQVNRKNHEIKFCDFYSDKNNFTISYPEIIQPNKYQEIIITEGGFTSPRTIHWLDKNGNIKYSQKIQLGWGGFVVEKN
ncbi:hypothetical protein [Lentilactobacillus kosonis]|uniref:Competence protein ComGD n=1 Tax=Lentilactobacillus kosonis TaxID=2810561 RepID=A0A401FLL9_9LACO|nr:hypothetical protein [Lentilactobacillus kosonis]GAY73158.1 hypothetical protein NBRC111893_1304 [Lentilactobacillus kosonis]